MGFLAFAMASNGMVSIYSIRLGNLKEFYLSRKVRGKYTLLAICAKYAVIRICANLSQYDRLKQKPALRLCLVIYSDSTISASIGSALANLAIGADSSLRLSLVSRSGTEKEILKFC